MVSGFTCGSISLYICIWCEDVLKSRSFTCSCPVFLAPLLMRLSNLHFGLLSLLS